MSARGDPAAAVAISCAPPRRHRKPAGLACCVHTNMEARLAPREPAHAHRRQPDVTACFAPSFQGMPPRSACRNSICHPRPPPFDPRKTPQWPAVCACTFGFLGVRARCVRKATRPPCFLAGRDAVCVLYVRVSAAVLSEKPPAGRGSEGRGFSGVLFSGARASSSFSPPSVRPPLAAS